MSSNADIFNSILRQQIFNQRFGAGRGNAYAKVVDQVRRTVKSELLRHNLSTLNKSQLRKVENTILQLTDDVYREVKEFIDRPTCNECGKVFVLFAEKEAKAFRTLIAGMQNATR